MRVPVAAACLENESCRRMGKPVRRFFCVCQSSGTAYRAYSVPDEPDLRSVVSLVPLRQVAAATA